MLLGEETNAAEVAKAKERWGLDQPLYVQYWKFLKSAAAGDFGKSFKYAEPVINVIKTRLPATIELAFFAIIIATLLAIPLGVWAGARPNSWIDNLGTTCGLFGISMPSFWLAIMLILLLAGVLNILPTSGRSTYGDRRPGTDRLLYFRQRRAEKLAGGLGRADSSVHAGAGARREHARHPDARHPLVDLGGDE